MKIEPGTQAYEILRLLCYTQEYPRRSAGLLGTGAAGWTKRVVKQLMDEGYIRLLEQGREIRSLGIRKKGWTAVYGEGGFVKQRVNRASLNRCHRLAEAAAMMRLAAVRIYPEEKPDWQTFTEQPQAVPGPAFWTSRELKLNLDIRRNFNSSRFAGVLAGARPYVVYNTGQGRMRWHDCSEAHTRALVSRMVRAPTDDAVILGQSMENALGILETAPDNARGYLSVSTSYRNMYFVPLQRAGGGLLQCLTSPSWRQRLIYTLLTDAERTGRLNNIENDGMLLVNGQRMPVLVACDCNLPQLYRLKAALLLGRIKAAAVYCLPFQAEMYRAYFGGQAMIYTVDLENGGVCQSGN